MRKKQREGKTDEENVDVFSFAPTGHGISEMMAKCCVGQGGFPDWASVMKGIMEHVKKQDYTTDSDAAKGRKT